MKKSSGNGKLMGAAASGFFAQQTVSMVKGHAFDDSGKLTPRAETWLTRAVTVQRPLVLANLRRLRKAHPSFSNHQLAAQLDKDFTRGMTGGGALIGATAAVPAVGTVTSLGLSAAATGSFLEACALYAQSIAELSGISTADPERAKLLVMGVMLGDQGRQLLGELSQQAGGKGAGPFSSLVPMNSSANSSGVSGLVVNQIKRQFMRRFFIRSGTTMIGRAIPFGIGMVVGGAANHRLASQIVKSAHKTFGELPEQTPAALVADMKRALERERLRAERRERRGRKREILAARGSQKRRGDRSSADALETTRPMADAPRR
ncbi:EcsC family protein [Nesterenkonia sp. YGD6]|uniref:EcsC family protein n=1 Tax=Nesterenkonia sp. YGD6 TaxID=2901231 RepID=UPI001F4CA6A8|nr:EcsC family protein [Nesterenkonia sp. YGD6]MCH8563323.1 EcsC family protein [Nesterenkonia sp. YGD6]